MEIASAVFPFLHIKTMPNRPNTILKVAIKVVNADISTILDTQKTRLGEISIKDYIINHEENIRWKRSSITAYYVNRQSLRVEMRIETSQKIS